MWLEANTRIVTYVCEALLQKMINLFTSQIYQIVSVSDMQFTSYDIEYSKEHADKQRNDTFLCDYFIALQLSIWFRSVSLQYK